MTICIVSLCLKLRLHIPRLRKYFCSAMRFLRAYLGGPTDRPTKICIHANEALIVSKNCQNWNPCNTDGTSLPSSSHSNAHFFATKSFSTWLEHVFFIFVP